MAGAISRMQSTSRSTDCYTERLRQDSAAAAYLDLSAQDPRVHVRLYDGMVLWLLGYPDQALRICAEARLYADASQHPFSEAMARTISLRVHQFRGEAAVVAGQVNAASARFAPHRPRAHGDSR